MAELPSGETPKTIVKGRFKIEGSAKLDSFAVATRTGENSGRLRIFTPKEDGSYEKSEVSSTIEEDPIAMTTGDFNGDGPTDVAVASSNRSHTRNKLTILFGTGAGRFSQPVTVNLAQQPWSLAAGRFSGAGGRDDIAVGALAPDQSDPAALRAAVIIVSNNGSGAFAAGPATILSEKNSIGESIAVAAANLTLPTGAAQQQWRDLAVAFVDRDGIGNPIARVKVLPGRDGGGFMVPQTLDLGAAITRSATVADLDDDGVVDLIVSTYGEAARENDGTIRFFQGKTGVSAGFHTNPSWFSIPAITGIRPRSLAAGRFGPKVQGPRGARANMGLAAANALELKTINVFLGNGRGAFVQPTVVTTSFPSGAGPILTGDFHSPGGDDPMRDLAFVVEGGAGRKVLSILFSNGAGGFAKPDNPADIPVGDGPHIAVSGKFDNSPPTDIVIIDTSLDPVTGTPFVNMLRGKGDGRFDRPNKTQLGSGERLVAMTAGRFSGQGASSPLDIVVVSGDGGGRGRLTLLVNDGQGGFPSSKQRATALPFLPAKIAAIDNPRESGRYHLVVRDANEKRFMLLLNLGPVDPGQSPFASGGFFGETGEFGLLVGDIKRNNASNKLNPIVTFDNDMTIKAFMPNEFDAYDAVPPSAAPSGDFSPRPPYTIADFGDGKPGLAAPALKGESLGIIHMKGDGAGGFSFTNIHMEPKTQIGDRTFTKETTDFNTALPTLGVTTERGIVGFIHDQFLSSLHGNNKPDVAVITRVERTTLSSGACPTDPQPTPPPFFTGGCRDEVTHLSAFECREINKPPGCTVVERICEPRVEHKFLPFCKKIEGFAPVITVFANTCGR
jgi:hypothetical protein